MEEIIKFPVLDNHNCDTAAELMIDTENDVFSISMKGLEVMSGDWSDNLQKVFQRALEMWKIEEEEEEEEK